MKLSTRSRYAVRAVFDIAYHSGGLETTAKTIGTRQRLSARYLDQLFQALKRAGIVGSKRGPRGGYSLLRNASEISVYDVLTALEGPPELVFCVGERDGEACGAPDCGPQEQCGDAALWKGLGEGIAAIFRQTTIKDLCDRAGQLGLERGQDVRFMYYI